MKSIIFVLAMAASSMAMAQDKDSLFVRNNYTKLERMIPMRDGIKLFTAIYVPKDEGKKYPFLMERTPYASDPYGENEYPEHLSRNLSLEKEKYIFVFQDVRGRYMSEGQFEEMTPHRSPKKSKADTDESSDTFDTIDWLLKNIKNNNGNVGIYGISYPGFYASASLPEAHPALKAVSPQAPVTDEFAGDDVYHNGAFFLMDNFGFYGFFDHPRTGPQKEYPPVAKNLKVSNSNFYSKIEPIGLVNEKYFNRQSKIWNEITEHNTYDSYWKARNIRPHLQNVKPAVLVVGGWFDAEDLFGPLHTYEAVEKQTPNNDCRIVMGPWTHGAWSRKDWTSYSTYSFDSNTADRFKEIEFGFFEFYLKGKGEFKQSEAYAFVTGSNEWKEFSSWPPKEAESVSVFLQSGHQLSLSAGQYEASSDEFTADPEKPVPYTETYRGSRNNDYMGADQRFAFNRPDVLSYQTEPLDNDMTFAGPIDVKLYFSTTGTDADLIVKVIDVHPEDSQNPKPNPKNLYLPGMQQLVRGDVLRGKFRTSLESPQAFVPNAPTEVNFRLNDICHTFKKGHRIMVQVQSSWFPLVDLNPQIFTDISNAKKEDFGKATHKIYTGQKYQSKVTMLKLK
jgi:hypothetical protein